MISEVNHFDSVNKAFSKQSRTFDQDDIINPILQDLRLQVYAHVDRFIKPNSRILELNAGTGIDAMRFVSAGHRVHATDLSDGMIEQIKRKVETSGHGRELTYQQLSFDKLEHVSVQGFDYVFSNFGGLNCIDDLSLITAKLPPLLNEGAYVTWVIMPPVCLWEIATIIRGNYKHAFRRFHTDGVMAHLEGQYFKTYYHSFSDIKKAFGNSFLCVAIEGLAALSPAPHSLQFCHKHPKLYKHLRKIDELLRTSRPFNRWADHIVVTFQYIGKKI